MNKKQLEHIRKKYMSTMLDFGYAKKYRLMLLGAENEEQMTEIMGKARRDWESRGM